MAIKIEPYQNGDEQDVYGLVKRVFEEFVAPGYSEEGWRTFYAYIEPAAIKQRVDDGIDFILLARDGLAVVGVLTVKNGDHISLMFVDKKHQRQGIARELYWRALVSLDIKARGIHRISVHSSPFAVPVYEHLGFVKTGEEHEAEGIRYIPMETCF